MGLVSWIIFGAIAGWIANNISKNSANKGCMTNIMIGILGSSIGGMIGSYLGFGKVTGFNIESFIIAVIGALILLSFLRWINKK